MEFVNFFWVSLNFFCICHESVFHQLINAFESSFRWHLTVRIQFYSYRIVFPFINLRNLGQSLIDFTVFPSEFYWFFQSFLNLIENIDNITANDRSIWEMIGMFVNHPWEMIGMFVNHPWSDFSIWFFDHFCGRLWLKLSLWNHLVVRKGPK